MSLQTPSYLLAASWSPTGDQPDLLGLKRIKPKGAAKLHWMDMNRRMKSASVEALSRMPMVHTVVVASPLTSTKQERARRKCLESLLPWLELRGVNVLVLESRGERNDKRDVELLLSLRRGNAIHGIDLTHRRGSEDANLWIPDQLLGAYAELELGSCGNAAAMGSNWAKIRPSITEIRVIP